MWYFCCGTDLKHAKGREMTTTFSGFEFITKANLAKLPKMLRQKGSGVLFVSGHDFPTCPVFLELFINPKVDLERLHVYASGRRGDLVDRHYRLVGTERKTGPIALQNLFKGATVKGANFHISYQASVMQGFSLDNPIMFVESQSHVPAAVTNLLNNLECMRALHFTEDDYKKLEAYIANDLSTKVQLKEHMAAGQVADNILGIF